MGCGALRKRVPAFKANSTFRTCANLQRLSLRPRPGVTYRDVFQYGHNENVQLRVPPSHHHAGAAGLDVRGPEYAHQPILLWHDINGTTAGVKRSPVASAALEPKFRIRGNAGALRLVISQRYTTRARLAVGFRRTRFASLVASRSTRTKMTRKKSVRAAVAIEARNCSGTGGPNQQNDMTPAGGGRGSTYDDSVVPGEDGKLVEAGDQVPAGGDVASYEDSQGQDGEGVHRIAGRRTRMPTLHRRTGT